MTPQERGRRYYWSHLERARAYYDANRERILDNGRAWRAANPEKVRTTKRAYEQLHAKEWRARSCKDCSLPFQATGHAHWYCSSCKLRRKRSSQRAYDAAHPYDAHRRDPKKNRAATRAYAAAHPDRIAAYRASHRKEASARTRAWRQSHPEQHRAYRRAFMGCAGDTINLNTLPPELKELALLLKRARQLIRNQKEGTTP